MQALFKTLPLVVCLLAGHFNLTAQNYSSSSKKAIRYFEEALSAYRQYEYTEAEENALAAIDKDENFTEAYFLLSDIYDAQNKPLEQAEILKTVLKKKPDKQQIILLKLIDAELKTGQYYAAEKHVEILENQALPARFQANLVGFRKATDFAIYACEHPVDFKPENCGPVVNSRYDDYFPALTADGRKLYKTVNIPTGNKDAFGNMFFQEDLYVTTRDQNGSPIKTEALHSKINTAGNEGAFTVSQDGRKIFFTVCAHSRGNSYHGAVVGSCDIFGTQIQGKNTVAENLGKPVNTEGWESQPSFSSDGKTLFFVSERPGGYGKSDIWKTELGENGKWSVPENLGDKINTAGDERTPFMHADGHTLYFSSDGHPGMGRQDIFMARLNDEDEWSEPRNIGYPVNTHADESGFVVNAKGDSAYFAAKREGGYGGLDIYRFAIHKTIRPDKTAYIAGKVYNSKNRLPLSADLFLYNTDNGKLRAITKSGTDGKYLICINSGHNYAFHVNKAGYMFYSERFELKDSDENSEHYILNIPLIPIEKGKKVILKNVFFDTDSYQLRESSFPELNRLVEFLKTNPTVKIEIGGHTDNTGSEAHNQTLSEKRAHAVYEYLLRKGIASEDLSSKGYGSSKPAVKNDSPENRQKNRRTEFKVLEK